MCKFSSDNLILILVQTWFTMENVFSLSVDIGFAVRRSLNNCVRLLLFSQTLQKNFNKNSFWTDPNNHNGLLKMKSINVEIVF